MRFFQVAITGLLVAFVTSAAPTSFRPTKYVNQIDKYSTVVRSSDPSLDGPSEPNDPQYFAPFDGIDETEEMEDPPVYETNGLIPLEGYTLKEKRNSLFTIAKPIVALAGSSLALEEQYHYQGKPILHEVLDRNMRAEGNSMSQSRARECSVRNQIYQ
ncbi:hypothetical protein HD553DRAFT_323954 [Filobasidium floriforme]|uniref:uncharacterized protein n=1 Tax=Filobasidium floriforme TaxID=5210 RepID=UPI001E8CAD01|nr:uncharacterized protein HD553DRAFT_323954 [Filobasidium floriforme]KAH8084588.1 hypothetical protein HD553DRAFT_323954 [Filobasidium floriforme]